MGISQAQAERLVDRRRREAAAKQLSPRPACGQVMRWNDTCARTPGHRGGHASRMAMDNKAEGKRTAA